MKTFLKRIGNDTVLIKEFHKVIEMSVKDSKKELTDDEVRKIQASVGYHPHGYNCYDLIISSDKKSAKWKCYSTCE